MNGKFIRCPHPKNTITDITQIEYYLDKGYVGQPKINGRRIQVHRMLNHLISFTRQGTFHTKRLDAKLTKALMEYMEIGSVLEGEYIFQTGKVFLFDCIQTESQFLGKLSWVARFDHLEDIKTEQLEKLEILTSFEEIKTLIYGNDPLIEGIVLKAPGSDRFDDDFIIRCRKTDIRVYDKRRK